MTNSPEQASIIDNKNFNPKTIRSMVGLDGSNGINLNEFQKERLLSLLDREGAITLVELESLGAKVEQIVGENGSVSKQIVIPSEKKGSIKPEPVLKGHGIYSDNLPDGLDPLK